MPQDILSCLEYIWQDHWQDVAPEAFPKLRKSFGPAMVDRLNDLRQMGFKSYHLLYLGYKVGGLCLGALMKAGAWRPGLRSELFQL